MKLSTNNEGQSRPEAPCLEYIKDRIHNNNNEIMQPTIIKIEQAIDKLESALNHNNLTTEKTHTLSKNNAKSLERHMREEE